MKTRKAKSHRSASHKVAIKYENPFIFREGTESRIERLCETCKPIIATWMPKFSEAADAGCTNLMTIWHEYHCQMFASIGHDKSEPFVYASLFLILNHIYGQLSSPSISKYVYRLINLLKSSTFRVFEFFYPADLFPFEHEMVSLAFYETI